VEFQRADYFNPDILCFDFCLVVRAERLPAADEKGFPMPQLIAYFDPGSGSMLMQAIVGGTAGLIVFARYLWEAAPTILRARHTKRNSESRASCPRGT
jgi:hypothetical protein